MPGKSHRGLALFAMLWLVSGGVARALPAGIVPPSVPVADPSTLCAAAIGMAQRVVNTPPGLLAAIATVESGRRDPATGRIEPWPWTIDADGAGHFYPTESAAVAAAAAFQARGVASLDIGCMQIDLRQHPGAFASLAQAFDPAANALYGAGFLSRLKARTGGWEPAVAAYHSQTPALGLPYEQKVLAVWQGGASPAFIRAVSAVPSVPVKSVSPKPASPKPGKPAATPVTAGLRHYGAGGFQFAALHGVGQIIPLRVSARLPGSTIPGSAMPGSASSFAPAGGAGMPGHGLGRGLAAYRATPIPISGAR